MVCLLSEMRETAEFMAFPAFSKKKTRKEEKRELALKMQSIRPPTKKTIGTPFQHFMGQNRHS